MPWLTAVNDGEVAGECSVHALAETWAVLTRLPIDPAISPAAATAAVERLAGMLDVTELDLKLYWKAIRRCSERDARSGALFDALHLVAAEESSATALVTFNPRDFERLSGSDSPSLVVPPDPPVFALPS